MGLVIFAAIGFYLLISLGVVFWAIRHAMKNRKSATRWGWGAALVMYLIPFWDWIPTVVTHQYYCATEAGFWVYKTPEQWSKENPGVMEGLVNEKSKSAIQNPSGQVTILNQRFLYVYRYEGPFLFNRWRIETEIRDRKNDEVIAREIDFSTSQIRRMAGWSGWKFWLDSNHCSVESHRDNGAFDQITAQVEGIKK